jgi:hypothetical protein
MALDGFEQPIIETSGRDASALFVCRNHHTTTFRTVEALHGSFFIVLRQIEMKT